MVESSGFCPRLMELWGVMGLCRETKLNCYSNPDSWGLSVTVALPCL
jgi:hypothetical protein